MVLLRSPERTVSFGLVRWEQGLPRPLNVAPFFGMTYFRVRILKYEELR